MANSIPKYLVIRELKEGLKQAFRCMFLFGVNDDQIIAQFFEGEVGLAIRILPDDTYEIVHQTELTPENMYAFGTTLRRAAQMMNALQLQPQLNKTTS